MEQSFKYKYNSYTTKPNVIRSVPTVNVKSINVIEDIESYDYRTGYPDYLRF